MNSRIDKRNDINRKRKKRIRNIFLTFSLLITLLIVYSVYQYNVGLKEAGTSDVVNQKKEMEKVEFKGKKDAQGRINVLLLGVDSRGEEQSRTDTIMIAQYDPKTGDSKIISLMRDIYVEIPGNQNYKINTAYFLGGPELLRKTIKENFDIDVEYYAIIDFKGFEKIVDTLAPEGIEINVEKKMSAYIHVKLEPGLQRLNGMELLEYARFRHDAEGDFGRVRRQQQVINVLKDELLGVYGVAKFPKLAGTIQPYIETNMGKTDQLAIIRDFLLNPPNDIQTLRIPIDNSYEMASYKHAGSVIEIDKEENSEAIKNFLDGTSTDTEEAEEEN